MNPIDRTIDDAASGSVSDGAMAGSASASGAEKERNVGTVERFASAIGGGALLAYGMTKKSLGGMALAALGAALAHRGVTGHCSLYEAIDVSTAEDEEATVAGLVGGGAGVEVKHCVTIARPASELYAYWHDFASLPSFMSHLESVTVIDRARSHWVAKGPLGKSVEWDAEIIIDEPNSLIAWRSLPGADVHNAGEVRFERSNAGTVVTVRMTYAPPMGSIGATAVKLLGEDPKSQVKADLRCFKQMMETRQIASTEGQPSGRVSETDGMRAQAASRTYAFGTRDTVEEASWESFPASDPPSY